MLPPFYFILTKIRGFRSSNGNASETKANESFDNGVFFDIEAKHTFDSQQIIFETKRTH